MPVSRELEPEIGTARLLVRGQPGQRYEIQITSQEFPVLVATGDEWGTTTEAASDEGIRLTLVPPEWTGGRVVIPVHSRETVRGGTFFVTGRSIEPPTRPALALLTTGGEPFDESSLEGKTLLINFWGTWCGPCIRELPALVQMQREFGERAIQIVGVACRDEPDAVLRAIEEYSLNYPVLMDDGEVSSAFGRLLPQGMTPGYPTTFLWDSEGRLRGVLHGAPSMMVLRSMIEDQEVASAEPSRGEE